MSGITQHKEFKVLATDLDLTLLTSDIRIQDFDKKMLNELQKNGMRMIMISGMLIF